MLASHNCSPPKGFAVAAGQHPHAENFHWSRAHGCAMDWKKLTVDLRPNGMNRTGRCTMERPASAGCGGARWVFPVKFRAFDPAIRLLRTALTQSLLRPNSGEQRGPRARAGCF